MSEVTEHDLITEAIAYMRLHSSRPLRLGEVAQHVGCSSGYLCRKFRTDRACTFTYCLNQLRVERSKILLLNPSFTVADVAYLVGFCEQGYFTKLFRKYVGITPRQYQRFMERSFCHRAD